MPEFKSFHCNWIFLCVQHTIPPLDLRVRSAISGGLLWYTWDMRIPFPSRSQTSLIIGDALVLLVVTLAGFAFHHTLASSGGKPLSTWLPWIAAWLLLAPHLKAFDEDVAGNFAGLWRPFWAMILASPLAGFLRAVWLDGQVNPVFVVVFGGIAALSIFVWRFLFAAVTRRRDRGG